LLGPNPPPRIRVGKENGIFSEGGADAVERRSRLNTTKEETIVKGGRAETARETEGSETGGTPKTQKWRGV